MPLYLGHTTAQRILEHPGIEKLPRSDASHLEHCLAARCDLAQLDLSPLAELPTPLDVLISSRNQARYWSGITCHRCPEHLPAGAFLELTSDLYIASPELLFVLRAQELSLPQAIDLGCWLCGTFGYNAKGKPIERLPLTSPDRLRTFVEHCPRMDGIQTARRALGFVIPNAASPMEAACAIPFYLPRRLGGFGLPTPELNYYIPLPPHAAAIAGKECIYIDVYWKDYRFGCEYQGEETHGLYSALRSDIARQLAAEETHIELQMMTIDQIRDQNQRLAVARKIARHLGTEIKVDDGFMKRNQAMVDMLLCGCR